MAIARAADSEAYATGGDHNRATASGEGSYAEAGTYLGIGFGDNNTATASGDGGTATAGGRYPALSDNNTATATADCRATAIGGATVTCP